MSTNFANPQSGDRVADPYLGAGSTCNRWHIFFGRTRLSVGQIIVFANSEVEE